MCAFYCHGLFRLPDGQRLSRHPLYGRDEQPGPRGWQHKEHVFGGFTEKYGVERLVWFEGTPSIEAAIHREKQIKKWKRDWKIQLVEAANPNWRDLYPDLLGMTADDPGSGPG